MRWFLRVFVMSAVACLACVPSAALAYTDEGWDPDDRRNNGDPDIEWTTRSVYPLGGVRYLKIDLDAYEELSDWWRAMVLLDTRGGPGIDFRMRFANYDTGGTECEVWEGHDDASARRGLFKQSGDLASCRVRAVFVDATKHIRWYLWSPTMHSGGVDRAPDEGWYT